MARTKVSSKVAAAARRRGANGEPMKTKVSVAIAPKDLAWAEHEAHARQTSVSAVFSEALHRIQRDKALRKLLDELGGTDDITDEDMAKLYAQWRAAGLKV
jgi:hypothetical protein